MTIREADRLMDEAHRILRTVFALCAVAAAVVVGCQRGPVQVAPGDSPALTAELAVEGAKALLRSRAAPKPVVPGVCQNCNGTGKIGDSVNVVRTCPVCRGTGKSTVSVLVPCQSGTCRLGVR